MPSVEYAEVIDPLPVSCLPHPTSRLPDHRRTFPCLSVPEPSLFPFPVPRQVVPPGATRAEHLQAHWPTYPDTIPHFPGTEFNPLPVASRALGDGAI